jgi:cullin 3
VTRTNKNEGALVGSQGGEVKKCILCVSTYQMVLLLMFNTREKVTYEEMREERLIPDR